MNVAITDFDHPITSEVYKSDAFEPTEKLGLVFWADDPEASVTRIHRLATPHQSTYDEDIR